MTLETRLYSRLFTVDLQDSFLRCEVNIDYYGNYREPEQNGFAQGFLLIHLSLTISSPKPIE